MPDAKVAIEAGPPAPDSETAMRWHEGERRGRLLDGLWREDLKQAMREKFPPERRRMQGKVSTTFNLYASLINQLSVLYVQPPIVSNPDPSAVEVMNAQLDEAGLWQLAIPHQQSVVALREGAYRFDVPDGKLLVRLVRSYLLWADSSPDCPDEPVTIHEYRVRTLDGEEFWTRDVLSIADPDNPIYRVESADGAIDFSAEFLGGDQSGPAYPYRYEDGTPYLPYVVYHATRSGKLWDPWKHVEIVDGSINLAVKWNWIDNVFLNASWPQRYGINVKVAGLGVNPDTGDAAVMTDPTTMVNFEPKVPGSTSAVGQFQAGGDPGELGAAIRDQAADLAGHLDINPADVSRTHADARSGYAIEITREGQRSAQRRFQPSFSRGDTQSLAVISALLNRALGLGLPETGWGVTYRGLPRSLEEKKQLMDQHKMRAELGVTSKPALLAALEEVTTDQARAMLEEMEADNTRFSPVGPPTQARTVTDG